MKKTLLITLLLIAGMFMQLSAYAIPAKPGLIEFRQPDGNIVKIYLHGDEKIKWATTTDGYTLLFNSEGYYEYAVLDYRSDLIPSGIIAKNPENRDASAVNFLAGVSKNLFYSQEQISYLDQIREIYNNEAKSAKAFPTSGSRKLVCILIGFTDRAFVKTQADFNSLFNQVGYTTGGATGSVKDFYLENSYDQFNLTVDVAGPYTASNTLAYYGANDASGNDLRPRELVTEAVTLANADVNYADYDNDSNGSVDGVYVIYAGYGEEAGAPANTIWAHAWSISTLTFDGKTISKYSCSAELRGTSGTNITRIGVICHEFGHVLGAPDYYDTDYSTSGQYDGTGSWDIMAAGSWNNDGATPAHHNAYTKISVYGWATATTLSTDQNVALLNAEQNSSSFYKYTTTTSNEYFLLENRQQVGFDASCPGHGMLIYHVDGSYVTTHMSANDINAGSHQGMFPMAANSSTANGVMTGDGAVSTSGTPWPGTSNKTTFTDATTPNSKSWASANTAKPLLSITESSGIIQFCFISCPPACTPPTTQASNFSTSAIGDNQMTVNWTRGNGTSVIVVAREGSSVDVNPFNGINYTADASFGAGMELGTGNFVVYKGTGTNVTVTDLTPGTLYYYSVFEFFTADNCYMLPGITGSALTTGIVPSYCDTLSQFCCSSVIYSTAAGYVCGTNEYDMTAWAEKYESYSPMNQITGARFYLAAANNGTNPDVTFNLYNNLNGSPGSVIASATVSLANVVTAFTNDGYIDVNFATTVNLPAGAFFLGFDRPGTPASGDTLALVSNGEDGSINTAYTCYSGSWLQSSNLWTNMVNFQHAIFPFLCFENSLPPIAEFSGLPVRIPVGGTVQFTDESAGTAPTSWNWTFTGGTPASGTDANPLVTYNAVGFYDVSLTVSNANGTDTETKTSYIEVFDPNGITAFSLDFEACTDFQLDDFSPWTTLDVDLLPTYTASGFDFTNEGYTGSFIAFNSTNTTPAATGWEAHGGDLCGICFAAVPTATVTANNDWLISRQIDLGTNSSFSFWAKSITSTYGLERFVVWVSTTDNLPASFTKISAGTYIQAPVTWTEYTYDLSAYNNQSVYIAVQCVSADAYAFMIDDIEISSDYIAPTCDFTSDKTSVVAGGTVNFSDLSTQMPESWSWSFPGGTPSTSTSENPAVVYNTTGTYDVSLTVTNAQGTDSETKTGYITVGESVVEWTFPTASANAASDGGITANNGTRNISLTGATTLTYPTGGATENCAQAISWVYTANTKWWQVSFTTAGYGNLKLSSKQTGANTRSPRDFKVQYSLNGTTWTDVPGATVTCVLNNWASTGNLTDIALPAACENQTLVYLRWLQSSNYAIGGGTNIQASQNSKIDDIIVTGLPLSTPPVADFSANDIDVCVGQNVTFTDATTNSPTSWAWTFTGGTPATSTSQNPVVTYASPGTYQVELTATNASGSDTETKTAYITVNANPTISASNAGPYCVGQTIALNATGSNGTGYSWTGPVSFTSAVEDPTRTNALTTYAGTYTVVLTNTATGCTASATTDITVNANPVISASNSGPYCAGSTIALSATGTGGNTFAWTGPDSYSTSTEDPSIANGQTVNAGTYTVVYTNTATGCSASANTVVVVNANPTIAPVNGGPYCTGQTISLTSNGAGGTSYSWSGPDGFASTATNPSITNGQTVNGGVYTLVLTNTTSGCTVSGSTTVVVNTTPTISASNSGPYCAGQTISLNATGSGGTAYSWTGPLSFTSAVEDPTRTGSLTTHSGTYTVVLTNTTSGCTASATTNVTVNALPVISASNTGPYCAGQTISLNATGSGGTGYAWTGPASFTSSLEDPTRASSLTTHSGTYTVVLTNTTSGCTASATTNVTVNALPTLSASNTGPYCAGQTIQLNATGSGGTAYSWTGPLSFTSAVEDPTRTGSLTTHSGTYTVVLTNTTSGCTASATTNVTVNALPTLSASNTGPYCAGQTIQLNATGSGGTDYSWTGPLSFTSAVEDPTRTNALTTHSGTYTVVLTNTTSGCTASATTNVTVNALPTLSASNTGPYCAGQTIQLNATGSGGTDYSWTGPLSFSSAVEDPSRAASLTTHSGTYTVVLTNTTSGCTASATTNVTVNALPILSASNSGPYCAGQTIQLNATGSGGTDYSWTGPLSFSSTVEDPSRTNALTTHSGTYTVVLANTTSGCTASATTNVVVNSLPVVEIGTTINSCPGITQVLDAGAGLTYQWSTSETTQTISVNTTGTYSVTVTDGNSCTASDNVVVNYYPATTLSMSSTPESASGTNDGTATVSPSGTSPFDYLWGGGQTSPSISGLTGGNYSVTVEDGNGCTVSGLVNVATNNTPPVADFAANMINICAGQSVTFTDLSTNTPTSWSWTFDGATTTTSNIQNPVITYTTPGSWMVELTVSNTDGSDTETKAAYITVNANPTLSASNSGPYCAGQTIALNATGTGGTAYAWTGPAGFTSTVEDPSRTNALTTHSGTYSVVLTNTVTGCTASATTSVTVNAIPTISASNAGPYCAGQTIALNATGTGGTGYAWTGPLSFTSSVEDPARTGSLTTHSGTYTVVLTNTTTGCTASATTDVTVNALPVISASNSGPYCAGQTISLNATGSGATSYEWTGPDSFTSTVEDPARTGSLTTYSGTYTVVLTNTSTNCSASATTDVTVNALPVISASNSGPYCETQTIALNATGSGGTSYAWTGPESFSSAVEDPARANALTTYGGDYTVVLTNTTSGCTASAVTNVVINDSPVVDIAPAGPVCEGQDIAFNATGSGGTQYSWSGPDSFSASVEDPSASNLQSVNAGLYTVTLTNTTTGCFNTASVNLVVNENPVVSAANSGAYCEGEAFSLDATGTGGTSYAWTGPDGFNSTDEDPVITNAQMINDGTYTVVYTNTATGCSETASTIIVVNANPTVDLGSDQSTCEYNTVTLDAGAGFIYYIWNGVSGTSTFEVPATNTYTVVVEDINGCTASDEIVITYFDVPVLTTNTTPESGTGMADGTATVNISGGTPLYNIEWNNALDTETITGLIGGVYTVTVTDDNGCTAQTSATVSTDNAPPVASFTADITEGCVPVTVNFTDASTNKYCKYCKFKFHI